MSVNRNHRCLQKKYFFTFWRNIVLMILVFTGPGLYFGAGLIKQQTLSIEKTPFIHWCGLDPHSEVYVTWETVEETGSFVKYGTEPDNLSFTLVNSSLSTLHKIHLTGLISNVRYYYQTGASSSSPTDKLSMVQSFKTAPYISKEFNITMISDTQELGGVGFYDTLGKAIKKMGDTDFLVNAGDLTETADNQNLWNMYRIPLVPTPGNHDDIDNPDSKYLKYFGTTENSRDVYYSFNWSNTQFIMGQIGNRAHVDPQNPRNTEHFKWLNETLEKGQDKDYRVLIYHINRLDVMAPIIEKYNVSLLVHGHAHSYDRYYNNNHTYVCLGNGATIQAGTIEENEMSQKRTNGAGFTRLNINSTGILLETFNPSLDVMDSVFLRRQTPTSSVLVPDFIKYYDGGT